MVVPAWVEIAIEISAMRSIGRATPPPLKQGGEREFTLSRSLERVTSGSYRRVGGLVRNMGLDDGLSRNKGTMDVKGSQLPYLLEIVGVSS